MRIKTQDLNGAALDWAVAKALGADALYEWEARSKAGRGAACYSTDQRQGGPIVDREGITTECLWPSNPEKKVWDARIGIGAVFTDRRRLAAAMRCFVFSKMGGHVDVPDELVDASMPDPRVVLRAETVCRA